MSQYAYAQQMPDDQFLAQNMTQNLLTAAPFYAGNMGMNPMDPYQQNYAQMNGGGWNQNDQMGGGNQPNNYPNQ